MKKVGLFLLAVVMMAGMAGCATTVPMGAAKQDQELKTFKVAPDKSGIYIYRNESMGGGVKMDVAVDGTPIGQTAAKTYLYKEVTPGKHTVTSKSENTASIEVETVSGKLYYIWQEVKMGVLYARTKLHLVADDVGQKGVLETKLAETK